MVSLCEKIYENSITKPAALAAVDETRQADYAQLWSEISGVAGYLQSLGLKKGDCVLVQATNTVSFVSAYYGIQYAGCIAVLIDKQVPADNVKSILEATGAKWIISAKVVDAPCENIDMAALTDWAAPYAGTVIDFPEADQPADLIFTTGTTGKAKGVLTAHHSLFLVAKNQVLTSLAEPDTVYMVYGPLNHVYSLRKVDAAVYAGFTLVLFDGMVRIKAFFNTIEKHGVTAMHLLPSAARMLLTLSKDRLGDYKDQIKYIDSGSLAYPDSDREKIMSLLPNTRLYYAYGASEVYCIGKYCFSQYPGRTSCVGWPMPDTRVFLVDDDRNEITGCTRENPGLIAYESKFHMIGYWNEPELTDSVLVGDTIYTNDLGFIDEDGLIYVIGRRGDVINVGGIKVSALELENLAVKYAGVAYAACIPVEDKLHGQVPRLFIEMEEGVEYNAADFKAFLAASMENYKLPRVITVLDKMPMTGVKVDKQALKNM